MDLYKNIQHLCIDKGMTIRQLEMKAGIGNGAIGKWRFASPKLSTLQRVADALNVPLIAVIYGNR